MVCSDVKVTLSFVARYAVSVHLPNFCTGLTQGLLMPLLPVMCRAAGYNDAITGSIISVSGLGRICASLPGSALAHHSGALVVMLIALVVYTLGTMVQLIVWDLWSIYVAYAFFGFAMSMFQVGRHQVLAVLVTKEERGRLMSLVGGVQRWAGVIGPLMAGVIMHFASPRWCLASQLPLVALSALGVTMSNDIRNAAKHIEEKKAAHDVTAASSMKAIGEHKGRVLSIGGYCASLLAMRGGRRLMLPLIALNFNLNPLIVGSVVSLSFLVDATFFWLGGIVMDKFGRRASAVPTPILMGLAYFSLCFADTVPKFFICVLFFGAADTLGSGLLLTLIADSAPPEGGSAFFGVLRTLQDSGQLIGPIVMGTLMHVYGVTSTSVVFGLLGLLMGSLAMFSPYFGSNPRTSVPRQMNAFAALPDRDDEDLDEIDDEHHDDVAAGERRLPGRLPNDDSSVDLDIDDDDLALFNAVHPGVNGTVATSVAPPPVVVVVKRDEDVL